MSNANALVVVDAQVVLVVYLALVVVVLMVMELVMVVLQEVEQVLQETSGHLLPSTRSTAYSREHRTQETNS